MDSRMRTELVVGALEKMAVVWRRTPVAGLLVHHSDRGILQYTAISLGKRLEEVGIAFPRWEGPEPLWTTPWQRELRRHLEDRAPRASTPLS